MGFHFINYCGKVHNAKRYGYHYCYEKLCYIIHIYYSFDTGEYHESVGLVFTRVPQARA